MPNTDPLDALAELVEQEGDIETAKHAAIKAAADAGHSLRKIAQAARMSHESVRRIVNQ